MGGGRGRGQGHSAPRGRGQGHSGRQGSGGAAGPPRPMVFGALVIFPLNDDGGSGWDEVTGNAKPHVLLVSDYATGALKLPGGKVDPESDADPAAAMAREFAEETGFAWTHFPGSDAWPERRLAVNCAWGRADYFVRFAFVDRAGPLWRCVPAADTPMHRGETAGVCWVPIEAAPPRPQAAVKFPFCAPQMMFRIPVHGPGTYVNAAFMAWVWTLVLAVLDDDHEPRTDAVAMIARAFRTAGDSEERNFLAACDAIQDLGGGDGAF
jgi:8-oxo-dGTP pyrophosphatase MutT (NUDIX family)